MSVQSVILLTPSFPADEHDRNCLPTLQLFVVELLQQNIEVHIIALDYPFSEEPYQWQGASVYPCGGRNSRWLKPRTIWRTYQRCCQLLDEKSAKSGAPGKTCLHSFWLGWASGIGEYVAKRRNLRHITTLMGQDVLLQNRHRFRFLSTERQKRLVALSDYQNEVFEKNAGFRAASVIPWGVSTAEIPSHIPDNRPIDVLGVGSFIPLKNWALWLETIALVAKTKPDLRAELIGSGPEKAQAGASGCPTWPDENPAVLWRFAQISSAAKNAASENLVPQLQLRIARLRVGRSRHVRLPNCRHTRWYCATDGGMCYNDTRIGYKDFDRTGTALPDFG